MNFFHLDQWSQEVVTTTPELVQHRAVLRHNVQHGHGHGVANEGQAGQLAPPH
jgi:hypothetical protein